MEQQNIISEFNNSISMTSEIMIPDTELQNIVHIGIQTDSHWLEKLKTELLSSIQLDLSIKKPKSKSATICSQVTKRSGTKSKKQTESIITTDNEKESNLSSETSSSAHVYPDQKVDDEFGVNFYSSSDDEEGDFDFEKLATLGNDEVDAGKITSTENDRGKHTENNYNFDAGLPMILKASKELGGVNIQPPSPADSFLSNAMVPGETCEFCKKPLVPMPSLQEQVDSSVDQSKLFCCQEFRDLVDFALAQKQASLLAKLEKGKPEFIDVSSHKNHKSPEEVAEEKEKSEKKIREKLLERQNAAIMAAQSEKSKTNGPGKSNTENPSIQPNQQEEKNLSNNKPTSDSVMTRQIRVINYQLSNCQFMKDGWTLRPPTISNEELSNKDDLKEVIDVDYTNFIQNMFGKIGLSNQCREVNVIRQYYPDGRLFMVLFPTGSASIYYPSGNLAISIIREGLDAPVICVIQDDSSRFDTKNNILGFVNTVGYGSFSHVTGELRIQYDTLTGMEMLQDGSRKRRWYWDGKPHSHAPPFQPLFLSINRYIGVRISSHNAIFVNFVSATRQIRINVGFPSNIPENVQKKMRSILKMETEKLTKPLKELKNKIRSCIEKTHDALGHPGLLFDNRWPARPPTLARIGADKKTTFSLSMM